METSIEIILEKINHTFSRPYVVLNGEKSEVLTNYLLAITNKQHVQLGGDAKKEADLKEEYFKDIFIVNDNKKFRYISIVLTGKITRIKREGNEFSATLQGNFFLETSHSDRIAKARIFKKVIRQYSNIIAPIEAIIG